MTRTLEATLYPDGTVSLNAAELPANPVTVRITFFDSETEAAQLSAIGDYLACLEEYEEALARGEIHWK